MSLANRLTGIQAFVEAVECGSFSAAAARMHVSRSAVAKSGARLEERLGARLFHRTPRSQSLTDDGQALYGAACVCWRNSSKLKTNWDMAAPRSRAACG